MQGGQINMGSQILGNNSQHSQHSQHSHESQQNQNMGTQGMQGGQNMQQGQMQSHMQALSQSHMQAVNDSNQNMVMNQMQNQMQSQIQNQMQAQMQNQMQNQQSLQDLESSLSANQDPLQQVLSGNAPDDVDDDDLDDPDLNPDDLGGGDDDDDDDQSLQDNDLDKNQPQDDVADNINDESSKPLESISQPLDDNSGRSTGSKSKQNNLSQATPARAAGPRGRGGKGKRLRDIADDLMPGPGAALSINSSGADGGLSLKRSADEMSGNNEGDSSSKAQKTDNDGPAPDTEKSGGPGGESNEGEGSSSLGSSMPKGDVEQHLLMLHKGLHLTSRTITHKCLPIVQQLIDDPYGWVFRDAVDPVVFGLPDYFEVVKNPMHLLLVKKKLENAVYTDMASFERDVKLVFENAILYNGEDSEVGTLAKTMMGVFEKEYKKVCEGM
jgi:hypothetical protein